MISTFTTIRISRWTILGAAFAGFVCQSWHVTIEYFQYQTTTHVLIQDYYEKVIPPIMVMCAQLHNKVLRRHPSLREIFTGPSDPLNDRYDTWNISRVDVTAFRGEGIKPTIIKRKYLKTAKYCMYIKIDNVFPREKVVSPRNVLQNVGVTYYYIGHFTSEPFLSSATWQVKKSEECRERMAYFFVLPDETSIFSAGLPVIMNLLCTENATSYNVHLTYTESVTQRLPPPYSTNCFDYNKKYRLRNTGNIFDSAVDILSSSHCYERCLTNYTAEWSLVPDTTAILRDKFFNSSMDIANIRVVEDGDYLANRTIDSPTPLIERYVSLSKKWPAFKDKCKKECIRTDCYSSRMIPTLSYIEKIHDHKHGHILKLSKIEILLKISDNPILKIETLPKQQFLDLFVYLCGGTSFWLGFCPIDTANWIESAVLAAHNWFLHFRKRRQTNKPPGVPTTQSRHVQMGLQGYNFRQNPLQRTGSADVLVVRSPGQPCEKARRRHIFSRRTNVNKRPANMSPDRIEYLKRRWCQRHPGVRHPYLE